MSLKFYNNLIDYCLQRKTFFFFSSEVFNIIKDEHFYLKFFYSMTQIGKYLIYFDSLNREFFIYCFIFDVFMYIQCYSL